VSSRASARLTTLHRSNGWGSPRRSGHCSSRRWAELFVIFFQSPNIGGAVGQFVASQEAFDQWFKGQVKDTTRVDLNVPPTGPLSDILSVYEA
jgi:hypothetical protein